MRLIQVFILILMSPFKAILRAADPRQYFKRVKKEKDK